MESNSALASLTANYSDSENEDERMDEDTDASTESQVIGWTINWHRNVLTFLNVLQVIIPPKPQKPTESSSGTEDKPIEPKPTRKKLKNPKKSLRLVSYNDDALDETYELAGEDEGEEEEEEEEDDSIGMGTDADGKPTTDAPAKSDEATGQDSEKENRKEDRWAKYGFSLPPEPKGKCSVELQDKINLLYDKMRNSNMDMNRVIQERKEFRNPSIYEKLIQFCDINEFGTNYPPEIYDPLQWGAESYYEELAKAQKLEMDRREKKKDNTKVELALAAAKKVEEEAKRRKSKWDQPGPSVSAAAPATNLKPAGLIQPALTTNITGTKGTVISAFGSLPKKPKVW